MIMQFRVVPMGQHDSHLRLVGFTRSRNLNRAKDLVTLIETLVRLKIHIKQQPMIAELIGAGVRIQQAPISHQSVRLLQPMRPAYVWIPHQDRLRKRSEVDMILREVKPKALLSWHPTEIQRSAGN